MAVDINLYDRHGNIVYQFVDSDNFEILQSGMVKVVEASLDNVPMTRYISPHFFAEMEVVHKSFAKKAKNK